MHTRQILLYKQCLFPNPKTPDYGLTVCSLIKDTFCVQIGIIRLSREILLVMQSYKAIKSLQTWECL
jgi:hypothetical protein